VLLAPVALTACGGQSTVGSATSLTKKAMNAHNTKYSRIVCIKPTSGGFVCEAVGSGSAPGFYAWCSIPVDGSAIGNFDPSTDCHWPGVQHAPTNRAPNNPVLTTPSRLTK
jgi:hypothetical protein